MKITRDEIKTVQVPVIETTCTMGTEPRFNLGVTEYNVNPEGEERSALATLSEHEVDLLIKALMSFKEGAIRNRFDRDREIAMGLTGRKSRMAAAQRAMDNRSREMNDLSDLRARTGFSMYPHSLPCNCYNCKLYLSSTYGRRP